MVEEGDILLNEDPEVYLPVPSSQPTIRLETNPHAICRGCGERVLHVVSGTDRQTGMRLCQCDIKSCAQPSAIATFATRVALRLGFCVLIKK